RMFSPHSLRPSFRTAPFLAAAAGLLVFFLLLARAPASAAVNGSFAFSVARAPHPLALDPTLADPAWAAGAVPNGSGPWQNVTTRSPSAYATTAYLLYDDKNLYDGLKAVQTGVPIVATQTTN